MIKLIDVLKQILLEEKKKADRCKRIADRKYDKPSAYKSGAIVRCRKGNIWKDLKETDNPQSGKAAPYWSGYAKLNEYSDKIINQLINKFKQENSNLETDIIKIYINRFAQIKDSSKVSEKDITKYNWKELENIVDSNQLKRIKAGKINDGEPSKDANLVYNQNKLRIYAGNTKQACVKYGNGYPFCISSRGGDNEYYNYRIEDNGTPYFIFDDTKTSKQENGKFEDPEHLLVIFHYITEDGDVYGVSNANNYGENTFSDFSKIESKFPKLKGLKNIFQFTEVDPKEKAEYDIGLEYDSKIEEITFRYIKIFKGKQRHPSSIDLYFYIAEADKDIDNSLKLAMEPKFKQYLEDIKQVVDEYRNKLSKIRLVKDIVKEIIKEDESLYKWFKRKGTPGKEGGWVDCNTCRDGKCKACGRKKGEKRSKYPSCRPTPAQCKTKGKGKKWGKTKWLS